jgi:DNA-binding MarR family transcriptional regulator
VVELATEAGITPSTATRILDALERRGVINRTRADDDRRAVTITLTPTGRELLACRHAWQRSREHAFYEALAVDQREVAPELLMRLASLIDELALGPAD